MVGSLTSWFLTTSVRSPCPCWLLPRPRCQWVQLCACLCACMFVWCNMSCLFTEHGLRSRLCPVGSGSVYQWHPQERWVSLTKKRKKKKERSISAICWSSVRFPCLNQNLHILPLPNSIKKSVILADRILFWKRKKSLNHINISCKHCVVETFNWKLVFVNCSLIKPKFIEKFSDFSSQGHRVCWFTAASCGEFMSLRLIWMKDFEYYVF